MGREPFWGGHPKISIGIARDDRKRRRLETAARFATAPPVYDGAPIVHKHYNADGDLVGWTEIESPWDDDSRAEAEALWEADRLICPMCGNLTEDCSDPDRPLYPQRHVCYVSKARAGADRKFDLKHDEQPFRSWDGRAKAKKPSAQAPFHFRDGVRVWVSQYDLTPDDNFI